LSGAQPIVTLYGRPGCHLCDAAQAAIEALKPRLTFDLSVVNIELDGDLHRRYLFEIPVVVLDGEEIARAPISDRALQDEIETRLQSLSS